MSKPHPVLDMPWSEALLAAEPVTEAISQEAKKSLGSVPAWIGLVSPSEWLAASLARLTVPPLAHANRETANLIALIVSQENSCRYCYGSQRAYMKLMGYRDAEIDRIEHDSHGAHHSRETALAIDFARKVSRWNPRPTAAERLALTAALGSKEAVAEIAFSAAVCGYFNRIFTLLSAKPDPFEAMVEKPLMRLLRPVIAWRIRARPRPGPEPLPQPNSGPCAELVATLAGSPAARILRQTIDDALKSRALPQRTKVLMLAVVAKTLGCEAPVAEARRLAAAEGLSDADFDQVLTNLNAPGLDARERILVPFARETVWYQAPLLQKRMREIGAGLSREETLETVGIVSLANMVCRLSVLTGAAG